MHVSDANRAVNYKSEINFTDSQYIVIPMNAENKNSFSQKILDFKNSNELPLSWAFSLSKIDLSKAVVPLLDEENLCSIRDYLFRKSSVTSLYLAGQTLPDENFNILTGFDCNGLKELNLSYTNMEEKDVGDLVPGYWPELNKLNLAGNKINDQGLKKLIRATTSRWPLTHLDLSHNSVTDASIEFIEKWGDPKWLSMEIDFTGNNISKPIQEMCLKNNRKFTFFKSATSDQNTEVVNTVQENINIRPK